MSSTVIDADTATCSVASRSRAKPADQEYLIDPRPGQAGGNVYRIAGCTWFLRQNHTPHYILNRLRFPSDRLRKQPETGMKMPQTLNHSAPRVVRSIHDACHQIALQEVSMLLHKPQSSRCQHRCKFPPFTGVKVHRFDVAEGCP